VQPARRGGNKKKNSEYCPNKKPVTKMLSRNEILFIKELHHKKGRSEQLLFVVEGSKSVSELLGSKLGVKKLFALPQWLTENQKSVQKVEEVHSISEKDLERISQHKAPQEVLALAELPVYKLEQPWFDSAHHGITLILDGIQDPGNLGTIIRTADWYGLQNIICSPTTADCFQHKVVQACMGSLFRTAIYYTDLKSYLAQHTPYIIGAALDGQNANEAKFPKDACLLIGSEGKGISDELLPFINLKVSIPRIGKAESLNAGIATAILLDRLAGR